MYQSRYPSVETAVFLLLCLDISRTVAQFNSSFNSSSTLEASHTTSLILSISTILPYAATAVVSVPSSRTPGPTIVKGFCPREEVGSREAYGVFTWPKTPAGNGYRHACPYNKNSNASRECLYSNKTKSGGAWGTIEVTGCDSQNPRSGKVFLLAQTKVNVSNVVKISKQLKNLSVVDEESTLRAGDIVNIATILGNIAAVGEKANEILDDFLATVDNVLDAEIGDLLKGQEKQNSSSRIVEALNMVAESLDIGPEGTIDKAERNFLINLQALKPQNFSGLNFSGIIKEPDKLEKNSTSKKLGDGVSDTLSPSLIVPRSIFNETTYKNSSANQVVIFLLYKETKFFRLSLADTSTTSSRLNSLVIAGSIKGLSVENLSVPVYIALPMIEPGDTKSTLCSYWDLNIGDWSQEGCKFERVLEDGRVLCSCNHFTNFAMLMDVYPGEKTVHDKILGIVSYVGCGLSLIGLTLTITMILILRNLRNQVPSQILLNFCVALSLTLIVFLAAVERSKATSLPIVGCRAASIAIHYLLLVTFFWMAVQAFNMYQAFVRVFTHSRLSKTKFMIKCCLFAWGTPALIVSITAIFTLDKYGDKTYCRLHGVPFIVAFLAPIVLILVGNIVAFYFIIRSLLTSGAKLTSDKKTTGFQHARRGIAIMVLLGLTWLFGILAIGDAKPVFQYLFCIFNTLQGLFVFIFFVVLPSGTRQNLRVQNPIVHNRPQSRSNQLKRREGDSSHFNNIADTTTNQSTPATSERKFFNVSNDNRAIVSPWKSIEKPDEANYKGKEHLDAPSEIY
ncbi:adhesion G-protein coupled receptor G6-like [Dendronephthya gigantea]|uniref:adhesion G-protein coupled receptor G6-like n=1 Tax=Dendronephthya gigantea TaxID=151771 RepID=UPI00106B4E02|nr:adhesion G-protein coupled receptor G6-like [Dendronephthya gigantea]